MIIRRYFKSNRFVLKTKEMNNMTYNANSVAKKDEYRPPSTETFKKSIKEMMDMRNGKIEKNYVRRNK